MEREEGSRKMHDLVSIIMPSYNTGRFIRETIESVMAQSYTNWELIIVDDCSTDSTDKIVEKYLVDKRIRFMKNDKNSGAAVSRNQSIYMRQGGDGLRFLIAMIYGSQINFKSRFHLWRLMAIISHTQIILK